MASEALLAEYEARRAKALAGGQTLIPVLKQRLNKPSAVIDLAGLGLSGITVTADAVVIGAMTTHITVANSADVKRAIPALATLAVGRVTYSTGAAFGVGAVVAMLPLEGEARRTGRLVAAMALALLAGAAVGRATSLVRLKTA